MAVNVFEQPGQMRRVGCDESVDPVRDFLLHMSLAGDAKKPKIIEIQYKFLRASGREAIKNSAGQPEAR
jgi:hypothetical protein